MYKPQGLGSATRHCTSGAAVVNGMPAADSPTPRRRPRLTRPQPLGPTLFTTLNPSLPAHSHSPPVRRPACQMLLKSLHPTHRQHSSSNGRSQRQKQNQPTHHLKPMHTSTSGLNVQVYREKSVKSNGTPLTWPEKHKSTKNLGTTSEFQAPEGWHEAGSLLRTHTLTGRPGFVHPWWWLCYNNGVFRRYQFKITNHHCIILTLEPLLRSLLNRVQVCDRPPSSFVKTVNKYQCPNQQCNRQLQWPTTMRYILIQSRNLLHTNMSFEFPHSSLSSFMIYGPAILSWEKGPRRTMGSKMGGHRGRRHRESLFLPEIQTRSSSPQAVILLTGMPLQDGDVARIQAHAGALKSCPKFPWQLTPSVALYYYQIQATLLQWNLLAFWLSSN